MPLDPTGLEPARRALLERPDDLEQAVQLQQSLTRLGLELPPEAERLLSEPDVFLLRIGEPKDPGAPVTRAAPMAALELLEDHDVMPAPRERPRRREPHHPGANYRDLPHRA